MHAVHLSTACLECRAQAKLAALQATTAEAHTDTASLRIIVSQKDQAVLTLKQQHIEKEQQAKMQKLGLGSLLVHAAIGTLCNITWAPYLLIPLLHPFPTAQYN